MDEDDFIAKALEAGARCLIEPPSERERRRRGLNHASWTDKAAELGRRIDMAR